MVKHGPYSKYSRIYRGKGVKQTGVNIVKIDNDNHCRTFSFGTDRYHFCGADRYNQFRTFRDNYNVEQIENRYCRTIVKQKGNISKEQAKFAIMKQTDISFEKGKVNYCLIDKDNYFKIDRIYYTLYSVQCTCILEVS